MSDHGRAHALLSPSSAERWLECPASIRMIDSLGVGDDGTNIYAEEGTRAHTLCEIEASYAFELTTQEQYRTFKAAWLQQSLAHGDDIEEMERHAQEYVELLRDLMADMHNVTVRLEQRVQTGVPGCWGTGDAILVSPAVIKIVDYKYGQGVRVTAAGATGTGNPQLMLYALGALEMFDGVLGDADEVVMVIHQPRAGGVSQFRMLASDLRRWRDDHVLPMARETQSPDARFGPSDKACRWCPAAGNCRARMTYMVQRDFGNPDLLEPEGLVEAVLAIPGMRDWCNAVEKEALKQAYSEGVSLPGMKVVMSGGKRAIKDKQAAIDALVAEGYTIEQVARQDTKTLADLECLVGKERLPEVLGGLLVKSTGAPSLVSEDDPRPAIDSLTEAAKDFQD